MRDALVEFVSVEPVEAGEWIASLERVGSERENTCQQGHSGSTWRFASAPNAPAALGDGCMETRIVAGTGHIARGGK